MTKRLKVYLLIVFAAACLACTLVGCKIGKPGRAELLAGYDGRVTYYSNGGRFNDSTTISVMEIYYKAGSGEVPFFNITGSTSDMKVERRGYDLIGWYEPARYTEEDAPAPEYVGQIKYEYTYTPDGDGNIAEEPDEANQVTVAVFPVLKDGKEITDSENDRPLYTRLGKDDQIKEDQVLMVCSDTLIADEENNNLSINRDTDEVVCAMWLPSAKINYQLIVTDRTGKVLEDDETEYVETLTGKKYKNGDVLISDIMARDGETPADRERVVLDGLSFVKTYMDEAMTEQVKFVSRPEEAGAPPTVVYCRYIVGEWTVIQSADSDKVRQMFSNIDKATAKYLIMDDIDYKGNAINLRVSGTSAATIICNGNTPLTISNLKFTISSTIGNRYTYSIFGGIEKEFTVGGAGLILKDISITLPRTSAKYSFYAICTSAASAAAANMNLTIDTITATYDGEPEINELATTDYQITHWICGMYANSDEEFLAGFSGIKLEGTNTFTKAE